MSRGRDDYVMKLPSPKEPGSLIVLVNSGRASENVREKIAVGFKSAAVSYVRTWA
jgi:hypothetical protein